MTTRLLHLNIISNEAFKYGLFKKKNSFASTPSSKTSSDLISIFGQLFGFVFIVACFFFFENHIHN